MAFELENVNNFGEKNLEPLYAHFAHKISTSSPDICLRYEWEDIYEKKKIKSALQVFTY